MNDHHDGSASIGILLMGVTGTGKSEFIASLTGRHDLVGNTLESHTSQAQKFYIGSGWGKLIYVVDSPGFDDTTRSDTEVLGEIVQAIRDLSKSGITIQGIIYLQRISDPRVSGATWKSLRMLECICGKEAFGNIILVSTMWDKLCSVQGGYRIGESYENNLRLRKDYWGDLVDGRAHVTRLRTPYGLGPSRNGGAGPWDIVMALAEKEPVESLQIWRELDYGNHILQLQDTEAGRYLEQDIYQLREKYEKELDVLMKDLEETRNQGDAEMEQVFKDEANRYLLKLNKANSDLSQLRANVGRQFEPEILGPERRDSHRFSTAIADNGEQGSDNAQMHYTNTSKQIQTQTPNLTTIQIQNPNQAQDDRDKQKPRRFQKLFQNH